MHSLKPSPLTLSATDGLCLSVVGDTYRILAAGKDTGGEFATIDMLIPPGGGPGLHAHPGFQETFYVIDGEIEVTSEEGVYIARKGAYVVIPKGGIVHAFKNKTSDVAHLLCVVVPSGLEEMFMEIGKPVAPNTFLPTPQMDNEMLKKMLKVAEKYGQEIYPPDYLINR